METSETIVPKSTDGKRHACPILRRRGVWAVWSFNGRPTVGHVPSRMAAVIIRRTGYEVGTPHTGEGMADAEAALDRIADACGEDAVDTSKLPPEAIAVVRRLAGLALRGVPILGKGEAFRIHSPGMERLRGIHNMGGAPKVPTRHVLTDDGMHLSVYKDPAQGWQCNVIRAESSALGSLCVQPGECGCVAVADPALIAALDASLTA